MPNPISTDLKIFVAGHRGLVGSAIVRALQQAGYRNLIVRTRQELDLLQQTAVGEFMDAVRPDYIFVAAARVGGILANNTYRAEFIYQNLVLSANIIDAAHRAGVQRLMYLGSSCIYPRDCPQPMSEEHLMTGPLEPTNEPYAIAKIAGIKMCESYNRQYGTQYVAAMPTNLYGPGDNYDLQTSHVLPALIRKIHEAKVAGAPAVTIWGTGKPRRELLFCDDLADACVFLMERHDDLLQRCAGHAPLINVGYGEDLAIAEIAELVREVVGYQGGFQYDADKPDGMPVKRLDISRLLAMGWLPKHSLREGIRAAYQDYLSHAGVSSKAAAECIVT